MTPSLPCHCPAKAPHQVTTLLAAPGTVLLRGTAPHSGQGAAHGAASSNVSSAATPQHQGLVPHFTLCPAACIPCETFGDRSKYIKDKQTNKQP